MTTNDKNVLADGLAHLVQDAQALLVLLQQMPPDDGEPAEPAPPEKEYTFEEARAILAKKARLGHRAEVKAIMTKHGVKQLSDVRDPRTLAAIIKEAEAIPIG